MGHLTFVGIFCFFLFALFSRIYFGYISAKRNKPNDPCVFIDIPFEGEVFRADKKNGFLFGLLGIIFFFGVIIGCFKLWNKRYH